MSDLDPQAIQQFEASLRAAGLNANQLASIIGALNARTGEASSRASSLAKSLAEATAGSRQQGAAAVQLGSSLRKMASDAAKGGAYATEEYRKAVEQVTASMGSASPQLLRNVKRYADAQLDAAERAETYSRVISSVSTPMRALGSGFGQVFSAASNSANDVGAAGKVLELGVSMAGRAAVTLGNSIQGAAGGLGMLGTLLGGPAIGGFVAALTSGLGGLVGAAGETAKAVASVIPTLVGEVNKVVASFQSLSSNGAIFTNGLQGMINNAGRAGVTLGQLDSIVKTNKDLLAQFGEGVAGGVNRLTTIMNTGGEKFRKQLFNLGYSVEDQASLIAETMRDLKQSGGRIPSGVDANQAVLSQTAKYAENLRIIADITGEDAKSKMAQARNAANELAFQQKLAGMDATQRQNIVQAMATMSPIMQKAFQQTVVFGNAIEPTTAAFLAQSESARSALGDTMDAYRSGTLTAQRGMEINANHADGIQQDMLGNQAIAMAGMAGVGGLVSDLKSVMQDELLYRQRWTRDAITQAQEAARLQGRPELLPINPVTGRTENAIQEQLTDIMNRNQQITVQMNQLFTNSNVLSLTMKGIETAANLFKDALDMLSKHLQGATLGLLQSPERAFPNQFYRGDNSLLQRRPESQPQIPQQTAPNTPQQTAPATPPATPMGYTPGENNRPQLTPAGYNPGEQTGEQIRDTLRPILAAYQPGGNANRTTPGFNPNSPNPANLGANVQQRLAGLNTQQRQDILERLSSMNREEKSDFLKMLAGGNQNLELDIIKQLTAGGAVPQDLAEIMTTLQNRRTNTSPRPPSPTQTIDPLLEQARLYHFGPRMPTGEELAAQREEEQRKRDEAADRADQEEGAIIRQTAERNRARDRQNNMGINEDSNSFLEKIAKSMESLKNTADEQFYVLKGIETYTKKTAEHVI